LRAEQLHGNADVYQRCIKAKGVASGADLAVFEERRRTPILDRKRLADEFCAPGATSP